MDTTLLIAIYGALLASLGFVWQVFTWWRSSGTRIRVTVRAGIVGTPGVYAEQVIMVTALNDSRHDVRVTSVGLELQRGSGHLAFVLQPPGATLPGVIPPHDSAQSWIEKTDFEQAGFNIFEPVRAVVRAANGKEYLSKRTTLMSR